MQAKATIALLFALVLLVCAQQKPLFPPSTQFAVNVTYTPMFFEKTPADMGGVFRAKPQKYRVDGHDDLRTSDTGLWRFDQNKAYAANKFGEFGYSCDVSAAADLTGDISFVPPFGFDATFFQKNAMYNGQTVMDGKKVDIFVISNVKSSIGQKSAVLFFDTASVARPCVKIVENTTLSSGDLLMRTMMFDGWSVGTQQDAEFELGDLQESCSSK